AVTITVEDTGIGIPAEHLERIWEEFHQVGNTERDRGQGIGLGLAIVRRLAGLLNHPVEVQSVPGQGSSFRVTVPLGQALPAASTEARPGAEAGGRLVLLVDDDAMVLLGLQTLFRNWGYRVMIAGSGDQALEQLNRTGEAPDMVVSDYRLRGGEVGTDVILRIRRRLGVAIPGIVLTGEAGREAELKAAELGLGFIHKPVTARQLSAALESGFALGRKAS
ncbi:MAG TPA: ATP-binding protein, partial [Candidatus Omnitrophota bacterium]|nr:ATP-binding protein [Candidatus Omnitrophota bacterium]